jgi:SAM-dependent methyltransferase
LFSKIKRAIGNSEQILPFLFTFLKQIQVKRIEKDGKVFFKYKGEIYPDYLNKGNSVSFIFDKAKGYCQGKGIDVGAGSGPLPGSIPIENEEEQNAYKLDKFLDGSLDYVFSSHCLEHLDNWKDALSLWIRKLKTNGILFLYLPHESMHLWNPGGPWVGNRHKWIPTYKIISKYLVDNMMDIIEFNPGKDEYWSFHIIARKIK